MANRPVLADVPLFTWSKNDFLNFTFVFHFTSSLTIFARTFTKRRALKTAKLAFATQATNASLQMPRRSSSFDQTPLNIHTPTA